MYLQNVALVPKMSHLNFLIRSLKCDKKLTTIDSTCFECVRQVIAVPQVCDRFSIDTSQASRRFKSLLGKDFSFDKAKTDLNSNLGIDINFFGAFGLF